MPETADGGLVVRCPERIDRRSRLGPFPSARDAAKFLCYAAAGALLAPWVSPLLWLPLIGIGFAVSVWKPDGRAADEKAFVFACWKFRSLAGRNRMSRRGDPLTRHGVVQLAPSQYVVFVRTAGCPIAYLPPVELEQKFELYRELLRATAGQFAMLCTSTPIRVAPVLPYGSESSGADHDARRGYIELAQLLCRRRSIRRVYFVLRNNDVGPDALARLEAQASSLIDQLAGLGIDSVRLRDRALSEAVHRFGWSQREVGP
jgi:hypothetical protein